MRSFLFGAVFLCFACSSAAPDPRAETGSPIIGGEPEADAPAAGWIEIGYREDGEEKSWRCGGTLVTSRIVLTAAHCLKDDMFRFQFGTGTYGQNGRPASNVWSHPRYGGVGVHDLAAVILDDPFGGTTASLGAPIADGDGVAVGYGITTSEWSEGGDGEVSAELKSARMHVVSVDGTTFTAIGISGAGCAGDSGSGFFADDKRTLLGVQSYGDRPCNASAHNTFASLDGEPLFVKWVLQCAGDASPARCLAGANGYFLDE